MECYKDSEKGGQTPKTESPIDTALSVLKTAIGRTQETMTRFETILASVLTHPDEAATEGKSEKVSAQTPLETQLKTMSDDVARIDGYLCSIQNRIQL